MLLISSVYKDNIFSLILVASIVYYSSYRKKVQSLVRVAFIVGIIMIF